MGSVETASSNLETLIEWLQTDDSTAPQVAHVRHFSPRSAVYAKPTAAMNPRLAERLADLGMAELYSHQALAYDGAMQGEDVVVVTGTNSGKTLCYNLPAAQKCMAEPMARALYLYPTKALAQDQRGKLDDLLKGTDLRCATYDGDTTTTQRGSIRKLAHIVLSNPDMLHVGILPGHEHWSKFLKSLRLVVIDEMHVYRGVFGSHVGGVLRRLLRLCEWHNTRPQIIACSATIGNPEELFEKLTGRKPMLIAEDGAPKAKRTFIFWNPPMADKVSRASANLETAKLMANFASGAFRTLAFSRARVSAELVLKYSRQIAEKGGLVEPERIESYRAGYTPKERREIESALFKGKLLGLSSTNAMELGVDVGGLDAVIMNGYPGTISSFWQQAGRAGRGTRDGLAVMVAHDDPLEQFLVRDPNLVLAADTERVAANPFNPQILTQQLRCAAYERAIGPSELQAFGPAALELAESLDRSGELQFSAGRFYYPSHEPPARKVNIRGAGGEQVTLYLDGEQLGTMEWGRALQTAHEGAVYLHRGGSYLVERFDPKTAVAELVAKQVDYYTQPILQSVIETKTEFAKRPLGHAAATSCGISVTDLVLGYRTRSLDSGGVRAVFDLDLPSTTYDTVGIRLTWSNLDGSKPLSESHVAGLHGVEHALMAVAPIIAGCDRGDLGSAWYAAFADPLQDQARLHPTIFVFDRTPGGVGLCEKLFESLTGWVSAALQLLTTCKCENGCPACLFSSRCEVINDMLAKPETIRLMQGLR